MTKKIWLFILSVTTLLWFLVSFADVIEPNTHYVDRCVKIENPHWIPWYKLIIRRGEFDFGDISYSVYDVVENECLPKYGQWWSHGSKEIPYLVDENIDVSALNDDKVEIYSIKEPSIDFESKLWDFIKFNQIHPDWHYVDDINPLKYETFTYKIVNNWGKYKLELVESNQGIAILEDRIGKFFIARILTVLIETVILFAIAKLCRKKDQISNKKLILIWILASTITLPLLRFVLPLFVTDETIYMVVWELLVTLIEIFIIKYWLKISRGKAILASVVCNLCSFIIWLLVF